MWRNTLVGMLVTLGVWLSSPSSAQAQYSVAFWRVGAPANGGELSLQNVPLAQAEARADELLEWKSELTGEYIVDRVEITSDLGPPIVRRCTGSQKQEERKTKRVKNDPPRERPSIGDPRIYPGLKPGVTPGRFTVEVERLEDGRWIKRPIFRFQTADSKNAQQYADGWNRLRGWRATMTPDVSRAYIPPVIGSPEAKELRPFGTTLKATPRPNPLEGGWTGDLDSSTVRNEPHSITFP